MKRILSATLFLSVFLLAGRLTAQEPAPYAMLLVTTDLDVKIAVNGGKEYLALAGDAVVRVPLERGENIVKIKPSDGGADGYTEIMQVNQPGNKVLLVELAEKRKIASQSAAARKVVIDKKNEENHKEEIQRLERERKEKMEHRKQFWGAKNIVSIRAGLNFSKIKGSLESSADGGISESRKGLVGFTYGLSYQQYLSETSGIRWEIDCSTTGSKKIEFTNQNTYVLFPVTWGYSNSINNTIDGTVRYHGKSNLSMKVKNTYLQICPQFFKQFSKVELSIGAYIGMLINSYGKGILEYSNLSSEDQEWPIPYLKYNLDFNFLKDNGALKDNYYFNNDRYDPEKGLLYPIFSFPGFSDTLNLAFPKTLDAYFNHVNYNKPLYKRLDLGLTLGGSYFITHSIFIGAKINYGLIDITNNKTDGRLTEDYRSISPRNIKHNNFSFQISLGFSY